MPAAIQFDIVKVVTDALRQMDWEGGSPPNVHDDAEQIALVALSVVCDVMYPEVE